MIYPDVNGLVIKSLTKMSLGIESNLPQAAKAFVLITAAGGAVVWYKKN